MTQAPQHAEDVRIEALHALERQVLWLSTAIVHHANRIRPNPSGLKVGGHQASSASMVSIMVKDPDPVDYSTGSVGIGATAPVWGAVARRYLNNRFGKAQAAGRQ